MTVFRRRRGETRDKVYSYDFEFRGRRHRGTTGQIAKEAAEAFELTLKDKPRRQAVGMPTQALAGKDRTPRFAEWAEECYGITARRVTRPERVEFLFRAILRFWGERPDADSAIPIDLAAPYHDLTLGAVLEDPYWIERFEQWMGSRGIAAQTRNHYRSALNLLYKVASEPTYRQRTTIYSNPVAGLFRERTPRRKRTLTTDELRAWIEAAPYHIRLAVAIGALAPTLRVGSILALTWKDHVDLQHNVITIWKHKTSEQIGRPLVAPIMAQLRQILLDARARAPRSTHVVTYQNRPLKTIHTGVIASLKRAGLPAGRAEGLTFHSLRHTAATYLVRRSGLALAKEALGHNSLSTTLQYAHLGAEDARGAAEELDAGYRLVDLVTAGTSAVRVRAKPQKRSAIHATPAERPKGRTRRRA